MKCSVICNVRSMMPRFLTGAPHVPYVMIWADPLFSESYPIKTVLTWGGIFLVECSCWWYQSSSRPFAPPMDSFSSIDHLPSRRLFELAGSPSYSKFPSRWASILDELVFGHILDHSRIVTERERCPKSNSPRLIGPVAECKFARQNWNHRSENGEMKKLIHTESNILDLSDTSDFNFLRSVISFFSDVWFDVKTGIGGWWRERECLWTSIWSDIWEERLSNRIQPVTNVLLQMTGLTVGLMRLFDQTGYDMVKNLVVIDSICEPVNKRILCS
jgi:hypothetical protein